MKKFPKKYIYKNKKHKIDLKEDYSKIYSWLISSDKKIHPWILFSNVFQDVYANLHWLNWKKICISPWFNVSSDFYNKSNINSKTIKSQSNQLQKNQKFFDKFISSSFFDYSNISFSEDFNVFLRSVFVDLYASWKISLQKKPTLWSRKLQTNIWKNNITFEKKDQTEYIIKYFVESKWVSINVCTKHIETIFWDVAIAVNPQDKRYKKFIWQNVIIPIVNRIIPIIWDETVDSFKWTWAVRITPWHDYYWFTVANNNQLQTDVFAIDQDWFFTDLAWEFAKKSVDEFFDNVVKYVDDIWNLDSKVKVEWDVWFHKKSKEKLDKFVLDQWMINHSYSVDYLVEKIESEFLNIYPSYQKEVFIEELKEKESINISNKYYNWLFIPIVKSSNWELFAIDDKILWERYLQAKSKKTITLSWIILNLILDNKLSQSFTQEELIDAFFCFDSSWNETVLNKYITIYEKEKSVFQKNWLKEIKKISDKLKKDSEKIELILYLLENSFAIQKTWNNYSIDFSTIFQTEISSTFFDTFSKDFIDSVWYVYHNNFQKNFWSYTDVQTLNNYFFSTNEQVDFCLDSILLSLEYSKIIPFSNLFFHPSLLDYKKNKIDKENSKFLTKDVFDNLNIYWPDVIRLLLILWTYSESWEFVLDTNLANKYSNDLNTIRNAYRFVYNEFSLEKTIKIKDLIKSIDKNLSDYDLWILHWLKVVLDDFQYQLSENNIQWFWKKFFDFFINIVCGKYLESIKLYKSDNTKDVVFFIFSILLKMLKSYVPFFSLEIESYFKIDRNGFDSFSFSDISLEEKNYKISVLMDLVDKLNQMKIELWLKKHDYIDIFIQASPEFLNFLIENQEFLISMVNVSDLIYVNLHDEIPSWYQTDSVININVWVKSVSNSKDINKEVLLKMKQDLENKKENLQNLKSLISSAIGTADPSIIAKKKKEVLDLQSEVDELELDINKLKIK